MHGCMDAWMHGCMDAWVDEYLTGLEDCLKVSGKGGELVE